MAAHDGGVRPDRGAALDHGLGVVLVGVVAPHVRAGGGHVGEHHAGAAENTVFQRDVVVHADVVLDLALVTDADFVAHKDVLTEGHAFAYFCAAADVHKVPDTGAFADLGTFVDDGAGVNGIVLADQINTPTAMRL